MRKPTEFEDHPMPFPSGPTYRAFCKHVVDGDTMDFLVDLGLHQYAYISVRLAGIDTPEIYRPTDEAEKERGYEAKAYVEDLILNSPVKIVTYKDRQSFGRYVADVFFWTENGWVDVAKQLRVAGLEK